MRTPDFSSGVLFMPTTIYGICDCIRHLRLYSTFAAVYDTCGCIRRISAGRIALHRNSPGFPISNGFPELFFSLNLKKSYRHRDQAFSAGAFFSGKAVLAASSSEIISVLRERILSMTSGIMSMMCVRLV